MDQPAACNDCMVSQKRVRVGFSPAAEFHVLALSDSRSGQVMNCTNCAAPIVAVESRAFTQCTFCGTRITLQSAGSSVDRVVWLAGQSHSDCPECALPLRPAAVDGFPCEGCTRCGGLLFERSKLHETIQERRAAYAGPDRQQATVDQDALRHVRPCPRCHGAMEPHVYYGPGNSVIDSCHACNVVWLDAGELTSIEQAPGRRQLSPIAAPVSADATHDATSPFDGGRPLGDSPLATLLSLFD